MLMTIVGVLVGLFILGVIIVASSTVLLSCEYTLISVSVPNTCCNNPSPTTFFILSS